MKSVLITFDQAYYERIIALLDRLGCRGFTYLERVQGRGSKTGDPHFGSHAWPSMCSAILSVVEDEKVDPLLDTLHKMDLQTEQLGLRAFVWNIERTICFVSIINIRKENLMNHMDFPFFMRLSIFGFKQR